VSGYVSWLPPGLPRPIVGLSPKIAFLSLLLALASACGLTSSADPTPAPAPTATPIVITVVATPTPSPAGSAPVSGAQALPSIADVVERITPWVASITVESSRRGVFTDFPEEAAGSGFVVRADGYIVTNNHVIQGAEQIQVHLPNGGSYDAVVVGADDIRDIAVLKIDTTGLEAARFANGGTRVGDWVMTMGNALDLKGAPTVTLGIISGLGRTIQTEQFPGYYYDLIQTDAAINSGNSGGPMVNLDGEVVGINQATLRQAQGISFAISASTAQPIIDSLIEFGRVVRPRIGFDGDDVTPTRVTRFRLSVDHGVIVTRIASDGPAFAAGIRIGNIVTMIDGIPTPDMATFLSLLWSYQVGDSIQIEYVRGDEFLMAEVKLGERGS
jgi:serine protease Do